MPFLKGVVPIRNTRWYLQQNPIHLRDCVRVFTINYCPKKPEHQGAKDFVFWHWAQLQFANRDVQLVDLQNITPTPFIRVFLDSGPDVLFDLEGQSKEEIHERIARVLGKTEEMLRKESLKQRKIDNPANFGPAAKRQCLCEMSGQWPCSALLPPPNFMKGKWRWNKNCL